MRIETNSKLIHRNRRIAHFLFFFSMAVLIGGFFIANTQLTADSETNFALALILPWLVLPVGFISTLSSVRMTNLWIRQPRPEVVIQEGLKGISKKSVLYNYYHFPSRHVLVTPQGVFAIITRFQEGQFSVDGDSWKSSGGIFSSFTRFMRRDGIGNPTQDAQRAAAHLKTLIASAAPDIEVQPIIIFVDPRAKLEINNPHVPALYADIKQKPNIKDYLRDLMPQQEKSTQQPGKKKKQGEKEGEAGLSSEKIAAITEVLDQALQPQ